MREDKIRRQRNMFQMREQDKNSEELSKKEISNLLDKRVQK